MNELIWPSTLVLITLIICGTYLIKNSLNKYGTIQKVSEFDLVSGNKGKDMPENINRESVERKKTQKNTGYETYYDIFISYRRLNSKQQVEGRDIARLLVKELKLYGFRVFYDYIEIKDNNFDETILPAIKSCKVFILLLTADALTRCSNDGDWVRREIIEARRNRCKIITVNPGHLFTSFPDNLPEELSFLQNIQMSSIDVEANFEITVEKMVNDRIASLIPCHRMNNVQYGSQPSNIKICIGENFWEMPDEFYNKDIYNALLKSYE